MTQPLDVVVVTHESAAVIDACLAPLVARSDLRVVVVDNASTDDTVARARGLGAAVIALPRNLGFAAAANRGAAHGVAAHVCFLNPDCVLTGDAIAAARAAWAAQPRTCLVPEFLQQDDGVVAGRQPGYSLRKVLCDLLEGHGQALAWCARLKQSPRYHDRRWYWPLGACVFVPRGVFEVVGGFDTRYFLYMEDCELGLALHRAGVPVASLPVTVRHLGHGGSRIDHGRRVALLDAARLQFAARHYGRAAAWGIRLARRFAPGPA